MLIRRRVFARTETFATASLERAVEIEFRAVRRAARSAECGRDTAREGRRLVWRVRRKPKSNAITIRRHVTWRRHRIFLVIRGSRARGLRARQRWQQ
jgi:hypothetical protein